MVTVAQGMEPLFFQTLSLIYGDLQPSSQCGGGSGGIGRVSSHATWKDVTSDFLLAQVSLVLA